MFPESQQQACTKNIWRFQDYQYKYFEGLMINIHFQYTVLDLNSKLAYLLPLDDSQWNVIVMPITDKNYRK